MLIINADDWGRCITETQAALTCFQAGGLQSVSAMMFMEDSERSAKLAQDVGIDVGLHLNLNQKFTHNKSAALAKSHDRVVRFMSLSKYAQLFYHPGLRSALSDVFKAQLDEFVRLYGRTPSHIEGHQHRHLCTNMLLQKVIPSGEIVRRTFSYTPTENGRIDWVYRRLVDRTLARRYRLTDYFFSLSRCLKTKTLDRVYELAKSATVELMAHPVLPVERAYLTSSAHLDRIADLPIGSFENLQSATPKSCCQTESTLIA
jgi:predicted glycoside hydrolase/deacetylase ChbG (UPF0249 family)